MRGIESPAFVSFENEIIPLLSKAGCNAGSCHGKAEGKNGFKLSVFGFDAKSDYTALVKEARGRRINLAAPEHSLLLRKGTARMPHGGGKRLDPADPHYRRLCRWIAEGAPNARSPRSQRLALRSNRPSAICSQANRSNCA